MYTTVETPVRELDRRTDDGFDVRLLWNSHTDRVFVAVEDHRRVDSFELEVEAADALAAFRHPFAYANRDHDARSLPPERTPAGGTEGRNDDE